MIKRSLGRTYLIRLERIWLSLGSSAAIILLVTFVAQHGHL